MALTKAWPYLRSPWPWLFVTFGVAVVTHQVFDVVPLGFWPLMGGAAVAVGAWQRRAEYRWPLAGVVGGVLTGVTAAVALSLAESDVVFLASLVPAGVLVVLGTRPAIAGPVVD